MLAALWDREGNANIASLLVQIPNNLLPYIQRVATGRLAKLTVYGGDYETPDGTVSQV